MVNSAILALLDLGIAESHRLGYRCEYESSDRSEAKYLYVCRSNTWFGYRIASHPPVYRCSADYQQILLPEFAAGETLRRSKQFLTQAIETGGRVVANPSDVWSAIRQAEIELADGVMLRDEQGGAWRWSAELRDWTRIDSGDESIKPSTAPRARLNAQGQCLIRHQLNFRAAWIYDELTSANSRKPTHKGQA